MESKAKALDSKPCQFKKLDHLKLTGHQLFTRNAQNL